MFFLVSQILAVSAVTWANAYDVDNTYNSTATIHQTTDGGYIMAISGYTTYVIKLDSYGDISWQKSLEECGKKVSPSGGIRETSDRGYVLAGAIWDCGWPCSSDASNAWIVKLDNSGNILCQYKYGWSSGERAVSA